ncbi:hypothetical protein LIA77_11665 [Sarocladium implicatum]|jgi:hypothetical protein|nr:hypothetical protein LIA77_11665 [Sarocladium implicatum]
MPDSRSPPAWALDDLRRLYFAAYNGGQVEFRDWISRLTAFFLEYPHLTASEMSTFVMRSGPPLRSEPSFEQLRRLDLTFRHAERHPECFDRFILNVLDLMIEYPHVSPWELERLRREWAQEASAPVTLRPARETRGQSEQSEPLRVAQPTDEELMYLDRDWVAAQNGGRGEYNGYLLNVVEMLMKYPHLSATELKDLHRAHAGH